MISRFLSPTVQGELNRIVSLLVLHRATPFNRPPCSVGLLVYIGPSPRIHRRPRRFAGSSSWPRAIQIFCLARSQLDPSLCGSASKPRGGEAKTMQFHPPPPLPCSDGRLKLKFAPGRPSLAASSQPCLLLPPQLQVGQQILRSNPARLHTGVRLCSMATYHHGLDRCLICKQPRTGWRSSGAQNLVAIVWSLVATIRMVVRTWWRRVSLGGGAVTCMGQVIRSHEKITCLLHYNCLPSRTRAPPSVQQCVGC